MSKYQRDKGAAFEREIARKLSLSFGVPVKRRLGQARDAGHDLEGAEPFIAELKRRRRIAVLRWYEQAQRAARAGEIPLVIMREDNGDAFALLKLDDLLGAGLAALCAKTEGEPR